MKPEDKYKEFPDLVEKTNKEIQRVGWTTQQGRDHLRQTYNVSSRILLTKGQLEEFLNYLCNLPSQLTTDN